MLLFHLILMEAQLRQCHGAESVCDRIAFRVDPRIEHHSFSQRFQGFDPAEAFRMQQRWAEIIKLDQLRLQHRQHAQQVGTAAHIEG